MRARRSAARPSAGAGAVIVGLALSLWATGCGSEAAQEAAERSPDPVVAAAGKAGDEDTARIRFTVNYSEAPMALSAEGVFQMVGGEGEVRLEATAAGQPPEELEMMVVDEVAYVRNPDASAGGPQWFRVPDGGQAVDGPAGSFTDPIEAVSLLDSAIDVEEVGTVDIDGEEATLHRGSIDLTAGEGEQETAQLRQLGLDQLPIEVAIDGEGRLRRIVITADLSTVATAAGPEAQSPGIMTITIDLVEFGVPLDLEAPPDDQVGDLPVPGGGPAPTVAAA